MIFSNGVTLEFTQCPAGEFQMVHVFNQNAKTAPVKITRPFWFSKTYVLDRHFAGAHPEVNGFQQKLSDPNDGGRACARHGVWALESKFLPRINADFKALFPKGYVARFPSMAEYQYAYHANSKDQQDPYWLKNTAELSEEQSALICGKDGRTFEYGQANRWGISGLGNENALLDRVDDTLSASCLRELKTAGEFKLNCYVGGPAKKDPLMWSESADAKRLWRAPVWVKHIQYGLAPVRRRCRFHLVIGPDLVSEWRAKNKKK